MPPEETMTVGTIKVMFTQIQKDLDELKSELKSGQRDLHGRCASIEKCISEDVKPKVQANKSDIDWLKNGFWFIAGVGSSALLLVVGVIISNFIGV